MIFSELGQKFKKPKVTTFEPPLKKIFIQKLITIVIFSVDMYGESLKEPEITEILNCWGYTALRKMTLN